MLRRFPNDLRWLPILRWSLGWDSATPPGLRFHTRLWWPAAWVAPRRTCRYLQPVPGAAHRHVQAHLAEHGRLRRQRQIGGVRIRRVGHLHVVGFVPRHHLVARDAVRHGMHDGPLRRSDPPAPLGLFARQFYHFGAADIRLQRAAIHEHAAPHDLARLADALETAPAQPEGNWSPVASNVRAPERPIGGAAATSVTAEEPYG